MKERCEKTAISIAAQEQLLMTSQVSVSVSVSTEALFDIRNGYIIFPPPPRTHIPITRWPSVFAKWRLRRASNSFILPPFAPRCLPTLSVHPSRSPSSLPPENGESRSPFHPFLQPVRRFFSLRRLARPSSSSTTTFRPFALDHSDLPFLSLDHSDRSRNKCHPHLPRFPLSSSITSMIILQLAINRKRRTIGCRFDPPFMNVLSIGSKFYFCYNRQGKQFCYFAAIISKVVKVQFLFALMLSKE